MKNPYTMRNPRRLFILVAALCAFAALPLLSGATAATSVNIVNNSSNSSIRNVYLSPVSVDDWSSNQLGQSNIGPGQSFSISNFACDQAQIKVIGEDQDGCFLSMVVACGENATWTITNDTPADCGQ